MTKEQALHNFFSEFGVPAYLDTSVPSNADLPYITYNYAISSIGHPVYTTANLWYRGTSELPINAKAHEISEVVTRGGVFILCDDGGIWITRGSPWCQPVGDSDPTIRRRLFNFTIEFLTID